MLPPIQPKSPSCGIRYDHKQKKKNNHDCVFWHWNHNTFLSLTWTWSHFLIYINQSLLLVQGTKHSNSQQYYCFQGFWPQMLQAYSNLLRPIIFTFWKHSTNSFIVNRFSSFIFLQSILPLLRNTHMKRGGIKWLWHAWNGPHLL